MSLESDILNLILGKLYFRITEVELISTKKEAIGVAPFSFKSYYSFFIGIGVPMKLRFTTNHIISCGSIEPFCILYYRVFLYVCQSATYREYRVSKPNIVHFALGNKQHGFVILSNRKSCFFYANPASGK